MKSRVLERCRLSVLACAATVLAGWALPAVAQGRSVNIRYATYLPEAAPQSRAAKWWADELKRESNGRINVRLFYASSLVPVTDGLPAVGQGRADMALVVTFQHARELALTTITELPFVSSNPIAAQAALRETYQTFPPFAAEYDKAKVRLMWSPPTGVGVIGSNRPIAGFEDFKGLRMRGGARLLSEAVKAVGADVISITSPELYEAMKRGVVDAYGSTLLESIPYFGLHEVTKYVVDPGSGLFAMAVHVMNKDFYERLSPEDKDLLNRVGEKAAKLSIDYHLQEDRAACDKLAAANVKVSVWPEDKTRAWQSKLPDFTAEWVKEHARTNPAAQEMAERYLAALRRAEAGSDYVPGVRTCATALAK